MTLPSAVHQLESVLIAIEDEILSSADSEFASMESLALETKSIVDAAVSRAQAKRRASLRTSASRSVQRDRGGHLTRRHAVIRNLLVANPRARDLCGAKAPEELSEAELDALAERFAQLGILPKSDEN
jgi:hypothetical protein